MFITEEIRGGNMGKYKGKLVLILSYIFILVGCGTTGQDVSNASGTEWEVIKEINDRKIIAELEQTTNNPQLRKKKAEEVLVSPEFTEMTEEFKEDIAYQLIEAEIVMSTIEDHYGGHSGFYQEGIIFMENKDLGSEYPGIWIGIKNPDERLSKVLDTLQEKVDDGEILAKYIYFYQNDLSQADMETLTEKVSASVLEFAQQHEKPNQVSWNIYVNPNSNTIELTHNFLVEENINQLQSSFADYEFNIVQDGRLVPTSDEPDVIYPDKKTISTPSKEGSYVVTVDENGMLVVAASANDFSDTGGVSEFYGAIHLQFPGANKKLEVGQRIKVETSGPILESYPAQGTAIFVEVLPEYKPADADLSEFVVVRQAISQAFEKSLWHPIIRNLEYDADADVWTVSIQQEDMQYEVEVKDE